SLIRYTTPESAQKIAKAAIARPTACGSRNAGALPRWPNSSPAKTIRFFVHCEGRSESRRLSAAGREGAASLVMVRTVLCAMRELPRGGPSDLLEAGERFFFRVVSLEHGQQLRNGQEILNPFGQVEQLQPAPLAADGRIRAHD